ncbi:MAG: porin family protein [Epsilonproteobacteria bacterium]|nr:porin family protein [Campylobacterota bacterium]
MKKALLFLLTFSTLYSFQYDAKFYIGFGGGMQYESLSEDEFDGATNSPAFGSLKFGYGDIKAYAIEIVLNYIDNQSNIFSPNDSAKYGMDVALLKAFPVSKYAYPYIRGGFGAGEMKVQRELDDKLSYSSFNIGGGVFIPLTKVFDMEITYEYRFTSYESIDLIGETLKPHSHINQLYVGVNYRF